MLISHRMSNQSKIFDYIQHYQTYNLHQRLSCVVQSLVATRVHIQLECFVILLNGFLEITIPMERILVKDCMANANKQDLATSRFLHSSTISSPRSFG